MPPVSVKSAPEKARDDAPKFVQRRGLRGFNNRPMPAHPPRLTPNPPAPRWRVVPVEKA